MSDPTPAVYLPAVEFIEVYNNSAAPIDLSSVTIHIGNKSIIPKSFQLMPDSFFVFWGLRLAKEASKAKAGSPS